MAGGCVWQGACIVGGMCGRGVCMVRGMHSGKGSWQGACMVGGACMAGGVYVAGGMCGRGGVWWGPAWWEGSAWQGTCMQWAGDTTRYGQWAGGTYPTGMHSCLSFASTWLLHRPRKLKHEPLYYPIRWAYQIVPYWFERHEMGFQKWGNLCILHNQSGHTCVDVLNYLVCCLNISESVTYHVYFVSTN